MPTPTDDARPVTRIDREIAAARLHAARTTLYPYVAGTRSLDRVEAEFRENINFPLQTALTDPNREEYDALIQQRTGAIIALRKLAREGADAAKLDAEYKSAYDRLLTPGTSDADARAAMKTVWLQGRAERGYDDTRRSSRVRHYVDRITLERAEGAERRNGAVLDAELAAEAKRLVFG